jgi:hypothetical protein
MSFWARRPFQPLLDKAAAGAKALLILLQLWHD